MKVPGVPFDQGRHPQGAFRATAVVLHRTYGSWAGDYSVGKNGRREGRKLVGIGFHLLIGKERGHWVEFYDTLIEAAHALGANGWAVGIEFEGTDAEPLTDWQVEAGRWAITAICNAHGIPKTYTNDGPRARVNGCLSHSHVPGSTHTDAITDADWNRMMVAPALVLPVRPPITIGATGPYAAILQYDVGAITGRGEEALQDGAATMGLHTVHILQDIDEFVPGDWGDSTTVTTAMWEQLDFLVALAGHEVKPNP